MAQIIFFGRLDDSNIVCNSARASLRPDSWRKLHPSVCLRTDLQSTNGPRLTYLFSAALEKKPKASDCEANVLNT